MELYRTVILFVVSAIFWALIQIHEDIRTQTDLMVEQSLTVQPDATPAPAAPQQQRWQE